MQYALISYALQPILAQMGVPPRGGDLDATGALGRSGVADR